MLERLLQDTGFHVRVAENGAAAIEIVKAWQPQFIWMDLRMPTMDGMETTRLIRSLPGGESVRIAAVTASAFGFEHDSVLAAGLNDFVQKPYQPAEIFECMARHLRVRYRTNLVPAPEPLIPLTTDALRQIPGRSRQELHQALVSLNVDRIAGVIERIAQQNPSAGSMLAEYAKRFAYSAILKAIEASQEQ